jgi:hypothetical protein
MCFHESRIYADSAAVVPRALRGHDRSGGARIEAARDCRRLEFDQSKIRVDQNKSATRQVNPRKIRAL